MRNRYILYLIVFVSILSLSSCGGGAGSSSTPSGEGSSVPFSVSLIPSSTVAQTNASILMRAKVLDGDGIALANVPVTFTNLSEPFGVISSALKTVGLSQPRAILSAKVVNTDGNGIATVTVSSTVSGYATIQAEVNSGVGIVRDKKIVLFSDTFNLPIYTAVPELYLDVDTSSSFATPDEPNDFILFKTTGDTQRYIRATVLYDASVNGKIITFGSDSTDLTFSSGSVSGREIDVVADNNGQATVLATVNPSALSDTTHPINVTATAADGAFNIIPLFLEPVVIDGSASSFSASPTTVAVEKTSTLTATVKINTGGFSPDGTAVNFTATCGSVDPFAQTTSGMATATFTAPATIPVGGICTVTGKVAGATIGSADITIVAGLAVQPGTQSESGVLGGSKTYTISGGFAPYSVTSSDPTLPPSPSSVSASGGTFSVTVPAGTAAETVTYTVTDSGGSTVAATLVITGPTSLQISPPSVTVVSGLTPQTLMFTISGSPNTPYITTSSDPTKAFNDDGAGGGIADNGIRDGSEGGIWNSLTDFSTITVTIPANVAAGTVTLNVFDSIGGTTSATITIIGGGAGAGELLILPGSASIVSSGSTQTFTFAISGGTPPYQTTSTDPSKAFNTTAGNGLWDAASTGTTDGTPITVTFPANVTAGTVTLNVFDSVGGTTSATITILSAGSSSALTITPSTVSVTGVSGSADNVTFTISGGVTPYQSPALSDNTAVVPNATVSGSTFTVDPSSVAESTTVKMTVLDNAGTSATANVVVMPSTSSLGINPNSIAVTAGTNIAFTIIGGLSPYDVYSSNTGLLHINGSTNPLINTSSTSFTGNTISEGSVTVTVVDSDGKTATSSVTINGLPPAADFTISCLPASVTSTATSSCTLTSVNGYNLSVNLSCSPADPTATGSSCSFAPASVTPTGSSILTLNCGTPGGPIAFNVVASDGSITHTFAMSATCP